MQLSLLLRRSLVLFWLISGLIFLLHVEIPGAPQLSAASSIVLGLLSLGLGLWGASGRAWRVCCYAQLAWLLLEIPWLASQRWLYLAHPLGLASKNLPIISLLLLVQERHPKISWVRAAVALVWLTEGLFPKILFQQQMELSMATALMSWLMPASPFLVVLGVAQIASGVLVLATPLRRVILGAQLFGLFALPLLVIVYEPSYALFLFAPLWKNLPIIAGTCWLVTTHEAT